MTDLTTVDARPKVFLSYSWSSEDHSARVLKLAEQLQIDGIDVVFDRWDLREGQDKHHFMERSVNDPQISRVLVLIDQRYVEKANSRDAGVGTETLIISPEVYRQADQQKFVPVIMDRDGDGNVAVPTYLNGRIYIDLSDSASEEQEYQRLIRNLYGKPELKRPARGKPPAYLNDEVVILETGRSLTAFKDAVSRGRPGTSGFLSEYLSRLASAFEAEVISNETNAVTLEERVVDSIDRFLPYRDEFIDMLKFVSRFGGEPAHLEALHQFFEQLLNIRYQAPSSGYGGDPETENLGFLAWEMFLYTVATFIRAERFNEILPLLAPYYVHSSNRGVGVLRSFDILDPGFHLLDYVRKRRLNIGWTSVSTSILRDRATDRQLRFEALIEADTLLWLRTRLDDQATGEIISRGWFPRTLHFCENVETVPLYVRMTRPDFFKKVSGLLGVTTVDDIKVRLGALPHDAFPTAGNFWGSARAYFSFLRLNA